MAICYKYANLRTQILDAVSISQAPDGLQNPHETNAFAIRNRARKWSIVTVQIGNNFAHSSRGYRSPQSMLNHPKRYSKHLRSTNTGNQPFRKSAVDQTLIVCRALHFCQIAIAWQLVRLCPTPTTSLSFERILNGALLQYASLLEPYQQHRC